MAVTPWVGRKFLRVMTAFVLPLLFATLDVSAASAPGFTLGSPNVALADPVVPRPSGRACVVTLFSGFQFTDFSNHLCPTDGLRAFLVEGGA